MDKKIVLYPNTFFWKDSEKVLFYSSKNNEWLLYNLDEAISSLCEQWENMDNLYAARPAEWTKSILELSDLLGQKNLGITVDNKERFVSLLPVLSIKHSLSNFSGFLDSEETLPYFHYLTAFLGGKSDGKDYWKQVLYPMDSSERLDTGELIGIISKYNHDYLMMVDIVVSDINGGVRMGDEVRPLSDLADALFPFKEKINYFFLSSEAESNQELIENLLDKGFKVTYICLDEDPLTTGVFDSRVYYSLIVRSEDGYKRWESIFQDVKNIKYFYTPVADHNLEFFQRNVFLSQEDILSQKLTKKQIFAHQAINKFNFGRLYLLPDGTVRSLPDGPSLGEGSKPIYGPIIRELEENHAWRQTRRLMSPCKDCIYHDLCPSPSVYERILGVPGCTVWQAKD